MGLIALFGYLGYLYNKFYNSNKTSNKIAKKNNTINVLEISGVILDIFDFFLISSEKIAPELLFNYYLQHKIMVKIIYFFGGLTIIGIFSSKLFIKLNIKNGNSQFNEVELR